MTQNKYVVGKKYKINYHWFGYEDAVVEVVSVKGDDHSKYKVIEVEYGDGRTQSFHTTSIVDDHTTPYEEEKPLVTEKVTKVIEAGDYGLLFIDEFKVGVDEDVTIELTGSVFTKDKIASLIETLNKIHEVM